MHTLFHLLNILRSIHATPSLLDIISNSFSALTDLLAIAITIYIFSEAIIQRKVDDDALLSKLFEILRSRQRRRLYISIIIYLLVFLLLFYCKAKGMCNSVLFTISHILVLMDTFYITWSIYNCISLERDTKDIAQSEYESVIKSITSFLDDQIKLDESHNNQLIILLNDWYTEEKWNNISFETYISRFSVVEKLIKNHEDFESPKLFEEDLERRINDRFSQNSELERKSFINEISNNYKVPFSISKEYKWVINGICPLVSHSMYSEMYSKLSYYRDLLRYFVAQGKKKNLPSNKSLKSISNQKINLLFNVFMLKTFYDYCSFMNLNNYSNDYGKFKFSCLYDCTLNHTFLKAIKFEESFLVRSNAINSYLNNSLISNSLWFNTRFKNSNLENNNYYCSIIINCLIEECEVSFSKYVNCRLEYIAFQNMICQQLEIKSTSLDRITGINLSIQNLTMEVEHVSNSVFTSVHINKFSLNAETPYDESKWNEGLDAKLKSLNEDMIYKSIIQGCIYKDNLDIFLDFLLKSSIWNYICNTTLININGIQFMNGSILNSERISCIDMSNSNYMNSNFTDIVVEKANMSGVCSDNGKFKHADMSYIMAAESTLNNASLYNSTWNVVNFYDSLLEGINATSSVFKYCIFDESNCNSVIWANVNASLCSFRYVKLKKTDWSNSVLDACVFESCKMNGCSFPKAKISNSHFYYNDLEELVAYKSKFTNSVLSNNMVKNAILRHVRFDNCRFENNRFVQCQIDDVSVINTTVINPDLTTLKFLQQSQLDHVTLIIGRKTLVLDENNSKIIIVRLLAMLHSF